jgi:hypothetical protein
MTNILRFSQHLALEQTGPGARPYFGERLLTVEKKPGDATSLTVGQPQGMEPLPALPAAKPH